MLQRYIDKKNPTHLKAQVKANAKRMMPPWFKCFFYIFVAFMFWASHDVTDNKVYETWIISMQYGHLQTNNVSAVKRMQKKQGKKKTTR